MNAYISIPTDSRNRGLGHYADHRHVISVMFEVHSSAGKEEQRKHAVGFVLLVTGFFVLYSRV